MILSLMKGSGHCRRIGLHLGAALLMSSVFSFALGNSKPQDTQPNHSTTPGSAVLTQLNGKRSVLLLVLRAGVLDTQGDNQALLDLALKADPRPPVRHHLAYDAMARKLNGYIKKYRSVTAAEELSDADFIIVFNLLEYRRILNVPYPYGELFVIVKQNPDAKIPLAVIWKSRKIQWAGDAINDLIRDLKTARGEL